jgi:hypothetical protein
MLIAIELKTEVAKRAATGAAEVYEDMRGDGAAPVIATGKGGTFLVCDPDGVTMMRESLDALRADDPDHFGSSVEAHSSVSWLLHAMDEALNAVQ